jgi:hypothetical protein
MPLIQLGSKPTLSDALWGLSEQGLDVEEGLALVEERDAVDLPDASSSVDEVETGRVVDLPVGLGPSPLVIGCQNRPQPLRLQGL